MTFLHSSLAAAGLACIAIPIIIHLLMHRRRKPVMWGAMRFLLEAYRRQRRRMRLEKWLLLACRCLVIGLLGLAIGRPLMGKLLGPGKGRTLYVLIDNSLTSGVRGNDGRTALEQHKQAAAAIIESLRAARAGSVAGEGDRIGLIALGGPAEALVMPPSPDAAAVLKLIDDLRPTDSRADLAAALDLVSQSMGQSAASAGGATSAPGVDPRRTFVAVLSEFREGSLDLGADTASAIASRLPEGVTLLASEPARDAKVNVSIVGAEPLRSVVVGGRGVSDEDSGRLVRVLLRRTGTDLPAAVTIVRTSLIRVGDNAAGATPAETTTEVRWARGQDAAMAIATLPPENGPDPIAGRDTDRRGAATAGAIVLRIDDDALAGDNLWRRPIEFRESLRVGIIAPRRFATDARADRLDPGTWARLALAPGGVDSSSAANDAGGIEIVEIEPAAIDAARLAGLDAVVLPRPDLINDSGWARIGLFVGSGGTALVTPPPGVNVHLWPDAMSRGLGLPSDWTIAREAITAPQGARLTAAPASGGETNAASAGLLALVEGELDELLRPVTVRSVLPLDASGVDSGRTLLKLDSGETVLWSGRPVAGGNGTTGRGLVVYLGIALSLDWSDLPAKPLMVPLMQEIVRQGVGQARGSTWVAAGSRATAPAGTVELRPVAVRASAGPRRAAPAEDDTDSGSLSLLGPGGQAAAPALRRNALLAAIDDRGAMRALLAVNPDARAGRVLPQPAEGLQAVLGATVRTSGEARPDAALVWLPTGEGSVSTGTGGPATAGGQPRSVDQVMASLLGSSERGSPIDLPLLIAALVFAIVEIGLGRLASHAEVLPAAVRQAAGAVTGGVIRAGNSQEAGA